MKVGDSVLVLPSSVGGKFWHEFMSNTPGKVGRVTEVGDGPLTGGMSLVQIPGEERAWWFIDQGLQVVTDWVPVEKKSPKAKRQLAGHGVMLSDVPGIEAARARQTVVVPDPYAGIQPVAEKPNRGLNIMADLDNLRYRWGV